MSATEPRTSIIDAVKTPLGFLVLGLPVVDGTVASLALGLQDYRPHLIWTIILSIPLFMLIVVVLAAWRPEALRGDRPLQESNANQLASDLFLALDGALSNLEPAERAEAWLTVADVITTGSKGSVSYFTFCSAVASRLTVLASVSRRSLNTRGPIRPTTTQP